MNRRLLILILAILLHATAGNADDPAPPSQSDESAVGSLLFSEDEINRPSEAPGKTREIMPLAYRERLALDGEFATLRDAWSQQLPIVTKKYGDHDWRTLMCRTQIDSYARLAKLNERDIGRIHLALVDAAHARRAAAAERSAEALSLQARSLAGVEEVLGKDDPQTFEELKNYAAALSHCDEDEKAIPLIKSSMTMCEKYFGTRGPTYATLLGNLMVANIKLRNTHDAISAAKSAAKLRAELEGPFSPAHLDTWFTIIDFLHNRGEQLLTETECRQALQFTESAQNIKYIPLYRAEFSAYLALSLRSQGRHAEAIEFFREGAPGLERNKKNPSEKLIKIYGEYADSARIAGFPDDAADAEARAARFVQEAERAAQLSSEFPLK